MGRVTGPKRLGHECLAEMLGNVQCGRYGINVSEKNTEQPMEEKPDEICIDTSEFWIL